MHYSAKFLKIEAILDVRRAFWDHLQKVIGGLLVDKFVMAFIICRLT